MKRYQCGDFGVPGRRPWGPPGCCPPACPPPCQPTCPPVMPEPCPPQPCPPQNPCVSGCVPTPWVLGGCYQAGQLVTYNGYLYVANVDNAAGVPGSRQTLPCCPPCSRWAPPGLPVPVGPTGPTGPAGQPRRTRPNRAPRGNGAHGSHGSPNRWTTARKNGGNLGEFGALLMQNIPYNIQTV